MLANMKYYVLTIVSIFLALAIGIYIGFMFDAQDILMSQKEDIVTQLENRFDYLTEENKLAKKEIDIVTSENEQLKEFNRVIYSEVIKDKLSGMKIAVIETSDDYVYSSITQSLELAGSEVISTTTIKDIFLTDLDSMLNIYKNAIGIETIDENVIKLMVDSIAEGIVIGNDNQILHSLNAEGLIDTVGDYSESIDYIIIAGGKKEKDDNRFDIIDKRIIDICKKTNIPIIGIEKENVLYSYIDKFKDNRISTVDNIDTIMGKVALVLAIDGRPGNYGIKPSAESLVPDLGTAIFD